MDPIFGIHANALTLKAQRAELLAANLVNADTPGFKARDIDFASTLRATQSRVTLNRTQPNHLGAGGGGASGVEALYRVPFQPSLDGNTVEAELEMSRFAETSLGYQASLTFLRGRIQGLRRAIGGQ